MLEVGTKAPDFTLQDQRGEAVSLSDFLRKKVVLYFYPKDNTPGCTRQACAFGANYAGFQSLNAVVIGVSKDSVASHVKFAEKYNLPFILLADPERKAIEAYGVWQEKKLYGKTTMGVVRRSCSAQYHCSMVSSMSCPMSSENFTFGNLPRSSVSVSQV